MNGTKKKNRLASWIFLGCIVIGIVAGLVIRNIISGILTGLGAGLVAAGIARFFINKKNEHEIPHDKENPDEV